jgi:hypothetical protein
MRNSILSLRLNKESVRNFELSCRFLEKKPLRAAELQCVANVGMIFRLLSAIGWESTCLAHASIGKTMSRMVCYEAEMSHAIQWVK